MRIRSKNDNGTEYQEIVTENEIRDLRLPAESEHLRGCGSGTDSLFSLTICWYDDFEVLTIL